MYQNHQTGSHEKVHFQQQTVESSRLSQQDSNVDELLKKVEQLLLEDAPDRALQLIAKSKIKSDWLKNATAVCQMRLGNYQVAIDIYRSILLTNGVFLRSDAPTVFKCNFAVALLLNKNIQGFDSALAAVRGADHPAISRLKTTVKDWKQKLTIWQKIQLVCGTHPNVPIELSFPPGDLH
ncbi:hypothetical protein V6x_59930 [Gimesia chilikensis]|uniref:Tetratricopeptide repeat protein n=1 Tax=Gimesia chilikensis TaxID=2605989 RepID=A0A517WLU8_9PLAN|nr:hypothetical protein [Gimesia chilikensis]QDU06241.1 hypothetical protein V6x_59930 [Gimesia chilikensis]